MWDAQEKLPSLFPEDTEVPLKIDLPSESAASV
jgi:hypothetical protein